MFDVFIAEVNCPYCGGEDGTPVELSMQTHLLSDGTSLRVGYIFDPVDVDLSNIADSGYLLVASPVPPETIRLADIWYCTRCKTEHWAIVKIVSLRIEQIAPVTMDRATLSSVNFISEIPAEGLAMSLL